MEITNLKAFVQVAKCRSYTRAAEEIYLTPSAVNKRVLKLEDELDIKLFDQLGHVAILTEAGNSLLPYAEEILLASGNAKQSIESLKGSCGAVSVGITFHTATVLPPILEKFLQQYPKVDFNITCIGAATILRQVSEGELDFYITPAYDSLPELIVAEPLWEEEMAIIISKNHPLAQLKTCTLKDLNAYAPIIPDATYPLTKRIENVFKNAGLRLTNKRLEVNVYDLCFQLVKLGLGWSFLPKRVFDDRVQVLNISDWDIEPNTFYAVYHSQKQLSKMAKVFMEMIKTDLK